MCTVSVNKETIEINQFVWNDHDFHLPADELLGTLLILEQSEKPSQPIEDPKIADYLKSRQLIEDKGDGTYAVAENQHAAITELGNQVSDAIGNQLTKVGPEFLKLKSGPTVMMMHNPLSEAKSE